MTLALAAVPPRRRVAEAVAKGALAVTALLAGGILVVILGTIVVKGSAALSLDFLTSFGSRFASRAGIKAAIVGTMWVGAVSMLFAVPVGIAAAVYLNEFARPGRLTSLLRASISNLAGVPSVVFGILGLALFVRFFGLGPSVAAAGLTLGLLTLPIIVVVSEEALKAVPRSMREAAFGLGASRWQVVRHHVLPYALPGILTGSILALARAIGETAPLILIGAATYIAFLPTDPLDRFTAIPIQAYFWASQPKAEFHDLAWASVLVLLLVVFVGNLAAVLLRERFQRRYRW